MMDIQPLAEIAVRAADLADKCEAIGELVAASVLRQTAREVEELILEQAGGGLLVPREGAAER